MINTVMEQSTVFFFLKFSVARRAKVEQESDWGSCVQMKERTHEGCQECSQVCLLRLSGSKNMKDFRDTAEVFTAGWKECSYFVRGKEMQNPIKWGLQISL